MGPESACASAPLCDKCGTAGWLPVIRRTAILEASSSLPISDVSCAFPRLPIATSSELQTFTAAYSSAACARRQKGGRRKSTWYGCVGERMRDSRFRIPHSVGSPLPSAQNNWQLGIPDPKLGRVRTSRARGGTKSSTLVDLAQFLLARVVVCDRKTNCVIV